MSQFCKRVLAVTSLGVVAVLEGCATLTGNENQPVSITAQTDVGQPVQGVRCSLRNDKGAWTTMAPSFVNVARSAEDLVIECRREGMPDGFARAISRAHGAMFGNIIFGGAIGAIIDHSKGTGYEYPNTIPVQMGRSIVVDRSNQHQVQEEPFLGIQQARAAPPAPAPTQPATTPTTPPAAPPNPAAVSLTSGSQLSDARYGGIQFPAQQELPKKPAPIAAMSFEVEKLARAQGCNAPKGAELLTEPGSVETYRVRCNGGGELIVKCEFRNCRVLN